LIKYKRDVSIVYTEHLIRVLNIISVKTLDTFDINISGLFWSDTSESRVLDQAGNTHKKNLSVL